MTASLADPEELDNVQATLCQLNPGHERMLSAELLRELALGELGRLAHGDQLGAESIIERGECRFLHARIMRADKVCFQNASIYACSQDASGIDCARVWKPKGQSCRGGGEHV